MTHTAHTHHLRLSRRTWLRGLTSLSLLAALWATPAAYGQDWPQKPVRVVVPYAPGGIADIAARSVAQKLSENTGQSFIVENRPGADTRIGTEYVARAKGDAHILLLAGGGFAVNNALFKELPYNTAQDFIPIALAVSNPLLLVTGANQPYTSVQDLIAEARAGKMVTLASGGKGTLSHMSMELLAAMENVPLVHVPYRGGSAHTADVVSGNVSGIFENPSSALPLIRGGKYRVLATTGAQRNPAVPDTPTVAESGIKGFEVINWFGLFAPAGLQPEITRQIVAQVERALADPALHQRFAQDGVMVGGPSGEAFGKFVADETAKWADIVTSRGITAD